MSHVLPVRFVASCATVVLLSGGVAVHAQESLPETRPIAAASDPMRPLAAASPAAATAFSTPAGAGRPSLFAPVGHVFGDLRRLGGRGNLGLLVAGAGAAAGVHAFDTRITTGFTGVSSRSFKPGAIVGGTPLELGAAFATYAIGRASDSPRAMSVGADLVRAQVLAEIMTTGIKQTIRRSRPEGGGYSFPSGHTTVSFASATVLQQHFGWRVGLPAYGVATYVAASRVQMKRHYLSDVAFGAALGIVAGRTVTVGAHRLLITPMPVDGGAGVNFTWMGRSR
jgi:membrane-associated phospholipid phosphatase